MRRLLLAAAAVIGFGLMGGSVLADDWHRGGHGRGHHGGHHDHWDHHHDHWDHHHGGRTVIEYRAAPVYPVYRVYDPYYQPYVPYYPQSSFGISTRNFSFFLAH